MLACTYIQNLRKKEEEEAKELRTALQPLSVECTVSSMLVFCGTFVMYCNSLRSAFSDLKCLLHMRMCTCACFYCFRSF
eukprot:m.2510 g.2510  ORF g.2510 m.2510 type:complete len:79 (+) comp3049_c0_seq1:65-301(+)